MLSIVEAEDEGLSVSQCAALARRSTTWVRDHIQSGALEAERCRGRWVVSARSFDALVRHIRRRSAGKPTRPAYLRLVIDNTGRSSMPR